MGFGRYECTKATCRMKEHRLATPLVAPAIAVGALLLLAPVLVAADENEDRGRIAVLELGATGEREISERTSHLGPAVGVEIEPIENWLEIEFGASTYRSQWATNWELELPFKKPYRL